MDENEKIPALLIISGPTASGKSALAEEIAGQYDLPIISADSRQVYRNFDIGTAKPSPNILHELTYEMIDIIDPVDRFSAGKFAERAAELINHKYRNAPAIIIAGGTGFYITALMEGLAQIPEVAPELSQKWDNLWEEKGIGFLQQKIHEMDPVFSHRADLHNPHRLLRALKVMDQTGQSIFDYHPISMLSSHHATNYFAIHHERQTLYHRINERVDHMMHQGLVEEVRSLLPFIDCPAMETVGYKELIPFFQNQISVEDASDKIKQHSRNYAKRQLTWLRKHGSWNWITPDDTETIIGWLKKYL